MTQVHYLVYAPQSNNQIHYIRESTTKLKKEDLAHIIYTILNAHGLLAEGVTPKNLEQCLTGEDGRENDRDGDNYLEIDAEKLRYLLVSPDKSVFVQAVQALENSNIAGPYLRSSSTNNMERSDFDSLILMDMQFSLSRESTIDDASELIGKIYREQGLEVAMHYLRHYLQHYYSHKKDALVQTQDYFVDVVAFVNGQTRPEDFRTTEHNGWPQAVVDCDVIAQLGFELLTGIGGGEAFRAKIVEIEFKENGSNVTMSHVVLVFEDTASGRTYILNDLDIQEIEGSFDNYQHVLAEQYDHVERIIEFQSTESYQDRTRNQYQRG